MANLGKCLLFYLRYPAEMDRLYEADEPNVEGLPNPDQTLERIRVVGDVAYREAAQFLETCAQVINDHLQPISIAERKRRNLNKSWTVDFRVAPRRSRGRHCYIGAFLDETEATLSPWVWCSGGRRAEDELVRILGTGIKSNVLMWDPGSVAIATIKIPIPEQLDSPVACEPLLTQLEQALTPITAETVKAITAVASRE